MQPRHLLTRCSHTQRGAGGVLFRSGFDQQTVVGKSHAPVLFSDHCFFASWDARSGSLSHSFPRFLRLLSDCHDCSLRLFPMDVIRTFYWTLCRAGDVITRGALQLTMRGLSTRLPLRILVLRLLSGIFFSFLPYGRYLTQ